MGGWDPITPLKPHLGPGFSALVARLQAAVDHRYDLPTWTPADHALHKRADRLAAANEAYHVLRWSRAAMREQLGIELVPLDDDPFDLPPDQRAWEPLPPKLAQVSFLRELQALTADQRPAPGGSTACSLASCRTSTAHSSPGCGCSSRNMARCSWSTTIIKRVSRRAAACDFLEDSQSGWEDSKGSHGDGGGLVVDLAKRETVASIDCADWLAHQLTDPGELAGHR